MLKYHTIQFVFHSFDILKKKKVEILTDLLNLN